MDFGKKHAAVGPTSLSSIISMSARSTSLVLAALFPQVATCVARAGGPDEPGQPAGVARGLKADRDTTLAKINYTGGL